MRNFAMVNSLLHQAYAARDDDSLTPLRVQAMLYVLHGWCLAITGQNLLTEPFIADKYGPILPGLQL